MWETVVKVGEVNPYISCCGRYDCALCDYHRGGLVEAAKKLLTRVEWRGSLKLIADYAGAYDFDEFLKGLRWLASREEPCRGCRFGGGWSWWPDCPVRDCVLEKGIDFCHQCGKFPCKRLREDPLLAGRNTIIEANERLREIGLKKSVEIIRKKYEKELQ